MGDFKLNYSQKMQQQFRLSPQMIQSISLMALPVEELSARIYEEAEKNPAIEILKDAHIEPMSVHLSSRYRNSSASDEWQAFLESAPSHEESLQEHLLSQLALLTLTNDERRIGERIIQNLDSNGFNNTDPKNLLTMDDPLFLITKMLDIVRKLDPLGTACADVQESLLVQAKLFETAPVLAISILASHFIILEKKRSPLICKALKENGMVSTVDEVEEALTFIRSLEPWPARHFDSVNSTIQYVVPEVLVRRRLPDEDDQKNQIKHHGGFVIEFLRGNLPQIELSPMYTQIASKKNIDGNTRKFTQEAVQDAKWFIKALLHRTETIYRAVQAIVIKQHIFFDKGHGSLVPLRLKDIAEEIGVHEATISRVSNGKYIQCDWGIFEIKYFFTNAVQSSKNLATNTSRDSKEAVKHQLRTIIEESETSDGKKLSDSKLVALLAKRGIILARRTVTKYRSELNIESSFDRT